jgi:hypothetical protein
MQAEEFDKLIEDRLTKCKQILSSKAVEYASDGDRLENFKIAARTEDKSEAEVLWGMFLKHFVSTRDLVYHPDKVTQQLIDDKITDVINYMLLLEAIWKEKDNNKFKHY